MRDRDLNNNFSEEFLALLNSIIAQRPQIVIQFILEHGFITGLEGS